MRPVSVIVPTRNRPEQLRGCLTALATQTLGADRFEVIVVDDGSDVSLEPTVAPFRQRIQIQLIRQANAGPARARNVGAAHASGAMLAFTDDDCAPEPDWLSALRASVEQWPDGIVGGHTVNALPDNVYSAASQLLVDYLYDYHASTTTAGAGRGPAAPPFFTSNNFAVSTALFTDIGGFAESFPLAAGEDRELCDRWQARGRRLFRAENAVVRHAHALSLSRFWRQHLNYGRGAFHLRQARRASGRPAVGIEPLSFYARLVTYPLGAATHGQTLRLMALLCVSQVANALGFASEARRRRTATANSD